MTEKEHLKTYEDYDPEYYDMAYQSQKKDIDFYLEQAGDAGGRILEVACGSGRMYLELLKAGFDVYGIDISEKMLGGLRAKAAALGLEPKVRLADMRTFRMDERFSLILIPFRSILHNITIDDQLAALKSCRRHLAENGKLVLNVFYPDRDAIASYGRETVLPLDTPDGRIDLLQVSRFASETEQIVEIDFTWKKGGKVLSKLNSHLAFVYKREFELLLRLAGFTKWQVFGGFDLQPLETSKQEMVWIIDK